MSGLTVIQLLIWLIGLGWVALGWFGFGWFVLVWLRADLKA